MSYSDFSLQEIKQNFAITVEEKESLFASITPSPASEQLQGLLKQWVPLAHAISTEKARSEFIIAPLLAEVRVQNHASLFSGITFNIDQKQGLTGVCDFILSCSEEQLTLVSPIIAIVEAKGENINSGLPQCMAEMIAARRFNEKQGNALKSIFGCVTTGTVWKFLKYQEPKIWVDLDDYYIREIDLILGIFKNIFSAS